ASAAGGATIGPRLLPGTYTVRMTKYKDVITTPLVVVSDPRLTHTPADRAAKLPAGDPLVARLRSASASADAMRKKIVATKEGGMITGEERLRENLADLYGSV